MFPWFPFFAFPQQHNKRPPKNLLDEILEVKAVETDRFSAVKTPFKIVFNVGPSNRCASTSILPKAPTEHVKIEFNAEGMANKNTKETVENCENNDDAEQQPILLTKSGDHCPTEASTSTSNSNISADVKKSSEQRSNSIRSSIGGQSPRSSPRESFKDDKPRTPLRKRSVFETSQAMRDIFGSTATESPFSSLQKENIFNNSKTEASTIEIPRHQQANCIAVASADEMHAARKISTHSFDQANGFHHADKPENQQDQIAMEEVQAERISRNRQRNVARVAPFAYFPAAEKEGETTSPSPPTSQKEEENSAEEKREEKRWKNNEQTWRPNGFSDEHHRINGQNQFHKKESVSSRETEEERLLGYQNSGHLAPGEPQRLRTNQSSKADNSEGGKSDKNSNSERSGIFGCGGGAAASSSSSTAELPEMVLEKRSANGTVGGSNSAMQLIIRNTVVVNDDELFKADILIEGGIIKEICRSPLLIEDGQIETIDADGKCVLPSGIDVHTMLLSNDPSPTMSQLSEGTKAAICGGTGTIIDVCSFPNGFHEKTDGHLALIEQMHSKINELAECSVGISVFIQKWQGNRSRQCMAQLVQKAGINSFVLELSNDGELLEALDNARQLGAFCSVFPEDEQMAAIIQQRFNGADGIASERFQAARVQQLCTLSELANVPLSVMSLSTSAASRAVFENGRSGGSMLSAEVSVSALAPIPNNSNQIARVPLCSVNAVDSLLEVLASYPNSLCVSDQRQASKNENGKAYIEIRMSVLWEKAVLSGKMDPMRFVAVTSSNAARCFNLYPKKGRIAVGSDADLVLWDFPNSSEKNIAPSTVILAGRIRLHSGKFEPIARPPTGHQPPRYMLLSPNSPHLFSLVRLREKKFDFADFARPLNEIRTNSDEESTSNGGRRHSSNVCASVEEQQASINRPSSRNKNVQSDQQPSRAATKVIHPPGGKSSVFW